MKVGSVRWLIAWIVAPLVSIADSTVAVTQTNQLNFNPGQIFRFGDTRDMDCTVQMKITGSMLTNANVVTDVRVSRAVDDQGRDLNRRVASFPQFSVYPFNPHPGRVPDKISWLAILPLKCPGASAKSIKQIRGEIDLAFPTIENGGLFRVTNFMAHPGHVITSPNLAKHGIKLTYHTLESYTDLQRANSRKYGEPATLTIERSCFSGIYGNPTNPPRTSVAIEVEDPNRVLLGLAFETGDGDRIRATQTCHLPGFRCYHYQQPPPSDLNLVVTVAAPGVVRTESFALVDIKLPWIYAPESQTNLPSTPHR